MFVVPIVCFGLGLAAMGRTKPATAARKLACLGPRTGLVYSVEDFAEIGCVVVRDPQKLAVAQFVRASVRQPGAVGLIYQHGSGDPRSLEMIRADFAVPPRKPASAQSPKAQSAEAKPPSPEPKARAAASSRAGGASTP